MERVLVTGGAGYIGSVLVRLLIEEGYKVRVLDSLKFGGESIVELLNNPNFEFVKGDIRNDIDVRNALLEVDYVANLAAIVGDPACSKEPEVARETNLEGTQLLYRIANELKVKKFVFSSTCSNYGKMSDPSVLINEESELAPISIYAETKVAAEKHLLSQDKSNACKPTCLRFSTVYGLSPRMRFDLTVNEFTRELAMKRELVIFGEQFWRPYCHVVDLARSVVAVIKAEESKVAFDVFNVGDTTENYTKKMLVDEIAKQIPSAVIKYVQKNEDPRDYRVSFSKIKEELGFEITKKVPEGIHQVKTIIEEGILINPDDQKYKNI